MMIVKRIILIVVVALCTTNINVMAKDVVTKLIVTVTEGKSRESKENQITLFASAFPFVGSQYATSAFKIFERPYVLGSPNVFQIPSNQEYIYVNIFFSGIATEGIQFHDLNNVYKIKAGSVVSINLSSDDYVFKGGNSNFLNIQSQLMKFTYLEDQTDRDFINAYKYSDFIKKFKSETDLALKNQIKLLRDNSKVLGSIDLDLLSANCFALAHYRRIEKINILASGTPEYFKILKDYYKDYEEFSYKSTNYTEHSLINSPAFANYIIDEMYLMERLRQPEYNPYMTDSSLDRIIRKIDERYRTGLKDKLLTLFSIRASYNPNFYKFYDKLVSKITNNFYRDYITKKFGKEQRGANFRDFKLRDTSNRFYDLNDFQNKVVIIDFWYTGCSNCVKLTKAMKPVYDHFSKNPNVIFLSISVDRDKNTWIKSVRTEVYTHKGSVNLYTNGEGITHDLIGYYGFIGYPELKIIQNGKIYAFSPTRPGFLESGDKITYFKTEEFISEVEGAIKEMSNKNL